jgi:hypothetical protein
LIVSGDDDFFTKQGFADNFGKCALASAILSCVMTRLLMTPIPGQTLF